MAKPKLSKKIQVDSDLSETAIERAFEQLGKSSLIDILKPSKPTYTYYYLRVASQGMSEAVSIQSKYSFYIEIDFNYDWDEWSLHSRTYNPDKKEHIEKCVWSPGA